MLCFDLEDVLLGPLVLLLPTPPVPPLHVADLPGPPPISEPLALLPVAVTGASLLVIAAAKPPVLPPVAVAGALLLLLAAAEPPVLSTFAVAGASLLLHFPLLVAVEPLLLLPVAGPQLLIL